MVKIEVLIYISDKIFLVFSKYSALQPKIAVRFCLASAQKCHGRVLLGDPVAKTPCSQCRGPGFDHWLRK